MIKMKFEHKKSYDKSSKIYDKSYNKFELNWLIFSSNQTSIAFYMILFIHLDLMPR